MEGVKKRYIWFWIFAILQGFLIYYLTSLFLIYFNEVIPELTPINSFPGMAIFAGLLAISTIGINYLIFTKK